MRPDPTAGPGGSGPGAPEAGWPGDHVHDADCQRALERVYSYLDGELGGADADEVRRHIETCERCYPEVRVTTELKDALRRAALGQPCCPDDLRDRVARMLRDEAGRRE